MLMLKGELMSDLIDRQAAIRWVKTECNPYGKPTLDFESGKKVIEHLEQMPSAQQRKTGQWIKRKKGAIGYNCSCCGKSDISNHFDYCPNCGADMRGEEDEQSENNT